ncbi:MAG: STAS domain-containing protein [Verrucomicrobia bacterium]|nr:STAS domain-containing protein [Verrucomicrobiota bacterium]
MIANKLREANLLDTSFRPANLPLVIDLSELTCVSSSDLAVLLDIFPRLHEAGISIVLTGLREEVLRIFEITHLDRLFCLVPARREAQHPLPPRCPQPQEQSRALARTQDPGSATAYRPGRQRPLKTQDSGSMMAGPAKRKEMAAAAALSGSA